MGLTVYYCPVINEKNSSKLKQVGSIYTCTPDEFFGPNFWGKAEV